MRACPLMLGNSCSDTGSTVAHAAGTPVTWMENSSTILPPLRRPTSQATCLPGSTTSAAGEIEASIAEAFRPAHGRYAPQAQKDESSALL